MTAAPDSHDVNPYRSPAAASDTPVAEQPEATLGSHWFAGWTAVFLLNLIVPLGLGWLVTREHGRWGMLLAVAAMYLGGWWFCARLPAWGRRLVNGSILIAVTQLFPVLHVLAGGVALAVAGRLGQLRSPGDSEEITSELGGLIVTLIVGCFFLVAAFGAGAVAAFFFPPDATEAPRAAAANTEAATRDPPRDNPFRDKAGG